VSNQIGACDNREKRLLSPLSRQQSALDRKRLEAITLDASRGVATNDAATGATRASIATNAKSLLNSLLLYVSTPKATDARLLLSVAFVAATEAQRNLQRYLFASVAATELC
jgi:hypothetical protein